MQTLQRTELRAINGGGQIPSVLSPTGYITVPDWVEKLYYATLGRDPD